MSTSSIVDHTRTMLTEHRCTHTRVLVGVSGGLDSVALLHILIALRQSLALDIVVGHINHGLRGDESNADAEFVQALCANLNIPCEVVSVDVRAHADTTDDGIEGAARGLRYAALDALALKHQTPFLLVAHNRDDVAETFLLNLARGAGLNGLASIPETRLTREGIKLLRPILNIPRSQIAIYAHEHRLTWREDATNVDIQYFRNRIRHAVIPFLKQELGADISEKIASASTLLRSSRRIVREAVHAAASDVVDIEDQRVTVHIEPLRLLSQPLQAEIVRRVLRKTIGKIVDRAVVGRLLALVDAETGSQTTLPLGWMAVRERTAILVVERHEKFTGEAVVVLNDGAYVAGSCTLRVKTLAVEDVLPAPGRNIAYVDADRLSGALAWRPWQAGDRFQPHGMQGTVLVSDLLTNHKVDHIRRNDVSVVCDDGGIVWVCGIRPADRVRVRSTTSHVRALTFDDANGPIVVD